MKVTGRFDDGEFVCVWDVVYDRWAVKVLVHPKDYPWIEVSEFVVMSAWTRRKQFTKDHVLYQRLRVQAIEALDETWIDWKNPPRLEADLEGPDHPVTAQISPAV